MEEMIEFYKQRIAALMNENTLLKGQVEYLKNKLNEQDN